MSVDPEASYQSLSERIREMIRHDRGFSIVNSSDSGGIPSPIRESDSFKKLIEFKESEATSEFNSRKVKKIEFSDTMTKEHNQKGKNKKNDKEKGEINFTHSSIDKMIFEDTDEIDDKLNQGLGEFGDRSIAETVKRSDSKDNIYSPKDSPPKDDLPIEQSFENPAYNSHRNKEKNSLRSSIDKKFFEIMNEKGLDLNDLDLPSARNSLAEYSQHRANSNRQMYENTDIQHQDSMSHRDSMNIKKKKAKEEKNEKKATKKEFEPKQRDSRENEIIDQDEIDRNSTIKKVELKEAIPKQSKVHDYVEKNNHEVYKNISNEFGPNGKHCKLLFYFIAGKYQSIEEDHNDQRINFDGRKSGEDKTVNFSVLSRSKSGDAKVHSSSKNDKESINTGAGENLYYGKSKETNGSKQVVIEEIEIPLDNQNEDKVNENKKTEKNIHSVNKKKVITNNPPQKPSQNEVYKTKPRDDKAYQRKNSLEKNNQEVVTLNSERKSFNPQLNEESVDKKRKQSDLIIKKGKVMNMGSGMNSKSISPTKNEKRNKLTEDGQSSGNVSFSKNKRDLFTEKGDGNYSYKSKQKKNTRTDLQVENDDYSNFLKQKELDSADSDRYNPNSISFKKKSRNDILREGSSKRHKTPTHIDTDQADMRIILAQDPKFRHQDRQNSRNDFTVYTSNTGGPSLHKDDFTNDMLNYMKVKDYMQINKGENMPITISSTTNKKTLERSSAEDRSCKLPNELNDFNFYTPNNQQNLIKNSSGNKIYLVNKYPLTGSAGYSRGLENDPAL